MPAIVSVSSSIPKHTISQNETEQIVKELFQSSFTDMDRLIKIFGNGQIEKRNFIVPKEWFQEEHSFSEKNDLYIRESIQYGVDAIKKCLVNRSSLNREIHEEEIDAIVFVSSSGLATPTIDARIMNEMSFSPHTKRIPLWGLGCAGGGGGLSRAYEYCLAFPDAKVLVLCIEMCSITFQRNDLRKSNLVGTSLFADGIACSLVVGDEVLQKEELSRSYCPHIMNTQSTLMPDSEDVMGWDVRDEGLYVIFSRDIPTVIQKWLKPNVEQFLNGNNAKLTDISHFVAHPGGKKVIEAYEAALGYGSDMTSISSEVLRDNGNMSSPTVLYVLKETMRREPRKGDLGLLTALGPGFSSELMLLEWR
ncbi:3-oxoacyl-[acyl-carrier-protein] synthase III C-terminal domain-containing protein [Evansella sp. AB-P1]|uniref:type III polyketide synthase n=1 Tax=Evansella sp. AB-P1 TaxID=3037653 RepID=UPI00241C2DE0|nr:3-oxoacyl-[acyl-carrier-protein] synthase III C-terminal domain-containing protein [Evansella sp. AB-P1]MDG5785920.1 3-oxoacyl-[acyl-carrier-protein] synthase III C-terminal domain-containing protein [Evansella sp. AB-P1]